MCADLCVNGRSTDLWSLQIKTSMTTPLFCLGWVHSVFFPWIFSFSDLINSQCFTYHFYMEDSNCTFLDTQSLYWAKQGICDILMGGGKHGSRDPCRQEPGSLEAESKILDRSLVVRELVRKKEKQDFLKTQVTRQGLVQRNRFWARALFKIGGQRQRGTSFQADMMPTSRGSDQVLKVYPISLS